ncbi:MAG: uracil-DNA glycosylase family protein [Clostridium sp.]|nr:uracil-DNA glycosylase family protein [Prevotella sp.]MCM1429235.1 uracil-DNA glycosylase family protein [Clostridium sp.]MCM1475732.1 uracil-DNA glycosylase family protein [Muribaculaceae bacterium]
MENDRQPILETHPWEPFIPDGAKVLIMGTFPPQSKRWAMNFYYPNRTNDFWKIMGLIFHGDINAFYNPQTKEYDLSAIKAMLKENHIALNDTGYKIRRLKDNASDKFLEIAEPVDLQSLLAKMPDCEAIATTGEKAAGVVAELTGTTPPKMGEFVIAPSGIKIWRMPSTSRAYPLPIEKKADYYRRLFPK